MGFDFGVRNDPRETRSKIDLPRMKEGGMDGIWFAVFVGQDESGATGIYAQDFVPGADTTGTRRRLAGFDPGLNAIDTDPAGAIWLAGRDRLVRYLPLPDLQWARCGGRAVLDVFPPEH